MSFKKSVQNLSNILNQSLIERAAAMHHKYRKAQYKLNKANKQLQRQGQKITKLEKQIVQLKAMFQEHK